MNRAAKGLLCLLLIFAAATGLWLLRYEPEVAQDSIVTAEGVITDRAMSDGLPYLSVAFPDGTDICCWQLHRAAEIPEDVGIGDPVRITYGVENDKGRFAVLKVERMGGA